MDGFRLKKGAALLSLSVGGGMLCIKTVAYLVTGSTAVLSDALESVVHVLATSFALYSVIKTAQPPDRSHPYGHGKVEYFSAGFEGALIVVAAVAILSASVNDILHGERPEQLDVGILLTLGAGTLNIGLGWYLVRVGKRTNSLTLVADGRHVLTDAYTSLGVVLGLVLVWVTNWAILDPLVAIAIAGNIIVTGVRLIRSSVGGLMDESDESLLREILDALNRVRLPEWIDIHHLRSWRSGERRFVDFHMMLPRYWDIERAHLVQHTVEEIVLSHLNAPGEVIIHVDPCRDGACYLCGVAKCPIRAQEQTENTPFILEIALGDPRYPTGVSVSH